jgi:taurine dioxygenase
MSSHFIRSRSPESRPERFAPLQLTQLMPHFGACIAGVDLTTDPSEPVRQALRAALLQYGVIFLTGQNRLSPERQLEVAGIFGKPDLGSPHVEKIGPQVDVITTDGKRPPVTNLWHSDNTTLENPSWGTLIQIQQGPDVGGNTGWASTRMAYECLSEPMKAYLEGMVAGHHWDFRGHKQAVYLNAHTDIEPYLDKVRKYPPREWPIVMTHPLNGTRSLYVNETYTTYIKDLHRYEGQAILQFLFSWIRMPEFYLTHHWQANDVAVWDNFSMQHYGLADYTENRVNQRVTFVGGD